MTSILLTTVFRPFGVENKYNKKEDDLLLDYLASRLTREPGLFALSSYVPNAALHLIAANLPAQTRVLEYPSVEEFTEEIKKGYDYIGITFVIKGFGKVAKMIALARKYAPRSKVILGGFGTALHSVEELQADYVCKGEGVRFMRELLKVPADAPIVHPKVTADITLKILQNRESIGRQTIGLITSGFGCPNACEFCCTSAYYGNRNVRFLQHGRDIYQAMCNMNGNGSRPIENFLIFEEDFMLYKDKVQELGNCIEQHTAAPLSYACFASIKGISDYDLEQLVAKGLGHVWIGVESVNAPFAKRVGRDIRSVFGELHSLGVTTTGSSIFGLDHHTPDQLPQEVDFLAKLRPSTIQISNLMAAEGTALRKRLEEEKRIKIVGYLDADLYSEVIQHSAFQPGQIRTAIFDGYRRLYETIGPSIYRVFDTWFSGYKNLRRSPNPSLQRRAGLLAHRVKGLLPLFLKTGDYLPNDDIRHQVKATLEEVVAELGAPTTAQWGQAELLGQIFAHENDQGWYLEKNPIEPELMVLDYAPDFGRVPVA